MEGWGGLLFSPALQNLSVCTNLILKLAPYRQEAFVLPFFSEITASSLPLSLLPQDRSQPPPAAWRACTRSKIRSWPRQTDTFAAAILTTSITARTTPVIAAKGNCIPMSSKILVVPGLTSCWMPVLCSWLLKPCMVPISSL